MIYGPAGAGKSTQGQVLARELGGVWISAGEISREKFFEYTKTAEMVPESELAQAILAEVERIEKEGKEVVFDGQPWSVEGARIMHGIGLLNRVKRMFVLMVPREELLARLGQRGRADDREENWLKKLDMYEAKMGAFVGEMRECGVEICEVDGEGSVEEVAERIKRSSGLGECSPSGTSTV